MQKITDEQVNKVNVSMTQKINLGNYETRDYSISLEIERLEGQSIEDVVAYGKDFCTKEIGDYYRKIKKGLYETKEEAVDVNDTTKKILNNIDNAKSVEQLESLSGVIKAMEDGNDKDVAYKTYNRKKITLDENND